MEQTLDRIFLDVSQKKLRQLTSRIEQCLAQLTAEQVWARGSENENAIGNLVLHLLYGVVLGVVWGSAESVVDYPSQRPYAEDLQVSRVSELGAARGLLIGLIAGTLAGAVVAAVVAVPSLNPLATIVGVGLTGAAFGGFVGSLTAS